MITLTILLCASAAKVDCSRQVQELPASSTMASCERVRRMMLDPQVGPLILPPAAYTEVTCKKR